MRERLSLDRNWRFKLGHAGNPAMDFEFARSRCLVKAGEGRGAAGHTFDDSKWPIVNIPHDWAIELPLDPRGDKEVCEHGFRSIGPDHPGHSVGWYRRTFDIPASDLGKRIFVEFDGVFRDSIVWINGHRLDRHASGYTAFSYDLTDLINYGGKNFLAVRVDATSWEGWWYEGAGIYRHVWLVKTDPVHIAYNGTVVRTDLKKSDAAVTIVTTVVNDEFEDVKFDLTSDILDDAGKKVAGAKNKSIKIAARSKAEIEQMAQLNNAKLWSCDEPNLYRVHTTISRGGKSVDEYETTFGVRTFKWDANRGFFLNGKPLKIKGTANHQQFGGLGVALPDAIHEFRLKKLKEMGSNAYRCSHYAVSKELLDACDRMGFLVMAENRLAGTGPEVLRQFSDMIVRDRNHPSIFLWSISNEEHTVQWSIAGERIGRSMVALAHQLDPTRKVTAAMYDRGANEGFANVVDVHGWNYLKMGDIEAFHKRRPNQPIVGSEEGSTVCTRGEYADNAAKGFVSSYDKRHPNWGSTCEYWWNYFADRPWHSGGFCWIGFDHYGEPIPYKWPCVTSHFGLMDICGFRKDNFYYFQTWWGNEFVLHLLPHWNWEGKEGQPIDVRAFSNADEVELFVNGKSAGRLPVKKNSHVAWSVLYEPGEIEARAYRGGKLVGSTKHQTTGAPTKLVATSDRATFNADGEDVVQIAVEAQDEQGRFVPTANDQIVHFEVTGDAKLIGVGNGNPSSHESEKANFRRLFNGRAMCFIQAGNAAGEIKVRVFADGVEESTIVIKAKKAVPRPRVE